jgi:hypothetical protein
MKKIALLVCLFATSIYSGPRYNKILTVTAGTPIQIATVSTPVNRVFIQMLAGGSGLGYVMDMSAYKAGTVPVATTSGNLTAQLCASTSATVPGCSYSDTSGAAPGSDAIDLAFLWVDGGNSGDQIVVSWDLRN